MSNYPAISDPTTDAASLREAVLALKETVEILTRQRGQGEAAAVTWAELKALGGPVLLDRLAELNNTLTENTESITTDYQAADALIQAQIDALPVFATKSEAEAGSASNLWMSPLRAKEAIKALSPYVNFAVFADKKAPNTDGGTATNGSYITRTLNTQIYNNIAGVSLSSDQVTLPAGKYIVEASAPAVRVNAHKSRLYNVTAGSVIEYGTNEFGAVGSGEIVQTRSTIFASFTLGVTSSIRLEHQLSSASGTSALGRSANMTGDEIYSFLKVWKLD